MQFLNGVSEPVIGGAGRARKLPSGKGRDGAPFSRSVIVPKRECGVVFIQQLECAEGTADNPSHVIDARDKRPLVRFTNIAGDRSKSCCTLVA